MSYGNYEELAEEFADNGIAGVVFDFTGTGQGSESDGETTDMTVLTEAADLNIVYDGISTLSVIDNNSVFLWGHSMGGVVSTYVAEQRPDDIKVLILVEPAYQMRDDFKKHFPEGTEIPDVFQGVYGRAFVEDFFSFDIYDKMADYNKNVIIINGTASPSVGRDYPEYFQRAAKAFPSAKVEAIDGADHNFMDQKGHRFSGEKSEQMMTKSIDFIKENIN